jgi:uncharacterized protein YuzB (UPF0349 family)
LALLAIAFRLSVRYTAFRKLSLDDDLVVLSWCCLAAHNILWHFRLHSVYELYAYEAGVFGLISSTKRIADVVNFLRSLIAFNVLFNTCLYSVKLSFLSFFYKLGQGRHSRNLWWWFVSSVTVAAYFTAIGCFDWGCSIGSRAHVRGKIPRKLFLLNTKLTIIAYCLSPSAKHAQQAEFRANSIIDVLTDCLSIL